MADETTQEKLAGKLMGFLGNRGTWHIMEGNGTICGLTKRIKDVELWKHKDGADLTEIDSRYICWKCVAGKRDYASHKSSGVKKSAPQEKKAGLPPATFLKTEKSVSSYYYKPATQNQVDFLSENKLMHRAESELLNRKQAEEIISKHIASKETTKL